MGVANQGSVIVVRMQNIKLNSLAENEFKTSQITVQFRWLGNRIFGNVEQDPRIAFVFTFNDL